MKRKLSKKIYILDCDYFYETSKVPNYKAMKISSYHKQRGDNVTFITEEYMLTNNYHILYLIREYRHTPIPSGIFLDDIRTRLLGKEFELFEEVFEMDDLMAMSRPDYKIYNFPEDEKFYSRASFVQFFNGKKYLKNRQSWQKVDGLYNFVVDEQFWYAPDDIILKCLKELKRERNIIFMKPIRLKRLLDDKIFNAFVQLKLAKSAKILYNNNIGEDFESVKLAIKVIKKLKNYHPYLNVGSIPVKIITKDHWIDSKNIFDDFVRCLQIMHYAQQEEIRINMKYPRLRLASPSWFYLEFFKTWSNHYHRFSYLEALLITAVQFTDKGMQTILMNPKYWRTAKIKQAVHLLSHYPELMMKYGFDGWSGKVHQAKFNIDLDYIKEKAIEHIIF